MERMKRLYSDLQARMAKRLLQGQQEENDEEDMYKRVALSKLSQKQAFSSVRTVKPKVIANSQTKVPSNKNNSDFAIFVDEFEDNDNNTVTSWKNLGTEEERHKENKQQPSTWTKPIVKKTVQKNIPNKIEQEQAVEIFVDEDLVEKEKLQVKETKNSISVRQQLDSQGELIRNPLKNFKS